MTLSVTPASKPKRGKARRQFGLALAGGGPVGGIYEVGALIALDEALKGVDLHELDIYVGVSSGAFIASNLVNGISTSQMARIFIQNESLAHPISPRVFLTPNLSGYLQSLLRLPGAFADSIARFLGNIPDVGLIESLAGLNSIIPSGIFANEPVNEFLADLYSTRGRTNDFRELKRKLRVVATDLDTGDSVRFGDKEHEHVPISKAIQASTALPGLYPPVEIDGRFYLDGALKRTLHASVALDEGADMLICINPIVPYDANLAANDPNKPHDKLTEGGLPVVLAQTFRALVHSRMEIGMEKYESAYPDRDIILLEPDRDDSRMFFTNIFSYSSRLQICQHAYEMTRADLRAQARSLRPILRRHGISLNMKSLNDRQRHFSEAVKVPLAVRTKGKRKNQVTNQLSVTLDKLQEWARQ